MTEKQAHDEAIMVMVESNLQRSVILPSEKAFAYKTRLEAMKRQAHPRKNMRRYWRLIDQKGVLMKNLAALVYSQRLKGPMGFSVLAGV